MYVGRQIARSGKALAFLHLPFPSSKVENAQDNMYIHKVLGRIYIYLSIVSQKFKE